MGSQCGQVREDEIRESHESNMIPEQFMVVMPLTGMGKARGGVELRMGESRGEAKLTAEYMNLELKGEAKAQYGIRQSSICTSIYTTRWDENT